MDRKRIFLRLLRISLGWLLLWGFFDKLFGLGFSTCRDVKTGIIDYFCEGAWINGGSPTYGFLKFGVHGPLAEFFHGLASVAVVDWLFMVGLLLIGLAFVFNFSLRLAGYSGALMMLLMYLGLIPPEHNILIDEHIIYLFAFLFFAES